MTTNTEAAAKTLTAAHTAVTAAEAEATAAESAYRDSLTTEDIRELERLAQRKLTATVSLDRARAILEAAEIRHAAAASADAESERQARYDAAATKAEAAAKKLRKDYPKLAGGIRDLLRELAEAEQAVREANAELPEGELPLAGPEADRSTPNLYREEVAQEVAMLWTTIDSTQPIADDLQTKVQRLAERRRGMVKDRMDSEEHPLSYGILRTDGGNHIEVVLKTFKRTKVMPHESGRRIAPLATEINLPPLEAGASPYWLPVADAHDATRQANTPMQSKPPRPDRVPEFEYELVPNA